MDVPNVCLSGIEAPQLLVFAQVMMAGQADYGFIHHTYTNYLTPLNSLYKYYEAYYKSADPFRLGFVDYESCTKLMRRACLNVGTIAKILTLADFQKNQLYDKTSFFFMLKMICEEQRKEGVDIIGVRTPMGVPKFKKMEEMKGVDGPFQLSHFDKEKYIRFFKKIFDSGISAQSDTYFNENSSLVSGRDIYPFLLSTELPKKPTLSDIYNLSDKYKRGALNFKEFCAALKLCEAALNNVTLPSELPVSLTEDNIFRFENDGSALAIHYVTGDTEEKKAYIALFKQLDADNDGFVTGKECISVFSMSRLGKPALAEIWNSADPMKTGKLDLDRFCHAMQQIERAKVGADVRGYAPSIGSVALYERNLDVASMPLEDIKQEINQFKAKMADMQPKIEYKENEIIRLQLDIEKLKMELTQTQSGKSTAQAECDDTKRISDVLMGHIKLANEQIMELQQKIKVEIQYQENMKAQHEKYVQEFIPQRQNAQELVTQQENIANRIIQERQVQEDLEVKLKDLETRINMAKEKNNEKNTEIRRLKEEIMASKS